MNTQLGVALISGVFSAIILPIFTQLVIPALRRQKAPPMSPIVSSGVGGAAGIALGYLVIAPLFVGSCPLFAPTRADIVSPAENAAVDRLVMVNGTACHLPDGDSLWLLVVPDGSTAYFPQQGPIQVGGDCSWSAAAYIGLDDPKDIGRGFVIVVALADDQGEAAIRAYFSDSSPERLGLEPLPGGVRLLSQLRVVRK